MNAKPAPWLEALIAFVMASVANRTDAYGRWRSGGAKTVKKALTETALRDHLQGRTTIGLHAVGLDQMARWGMVDVDNHGGCKEVAERNRKAAFELCDRLRELGTNPVLEDSDGQGGYHVWVFLDEPVPARWLRAWLRALAPDGLEVFPKQGAINPRPGAPGHYGNFARLPGRHHTRDHTSRFWCPASRSWIDWPDCTELLVDGERCPADLVPELPDPEPRTPRDPVSAVPDRVERCRAYLRKLPDAISGDRGHDKTFHAACECFRFGLPDDEARETMRWWNMEKSGDEHWTEAELEHKLDDARARVLADHEFGSRLVRPGGTTDRPVTGSLSDTTIPPLPDYTLDALDLTIRPIEQAGTRKFTKVRYDVLLGGKPLGDLLVTSAKKGVAEAVGEIRQRINDTRTALLNDDENRALRRWATTRFSAAALRADTEAIEARDRVLRDSGAAAPTMLGICLDYTPEALDIAFKGTKGALWSEARGRSLTRDDLRGYVPAELLRRIEDASDYEPIDDAAKVAVISRLQAVAYTELQKTLPDELGADGLGPDSEAARAFRNRLVEIFSAQDLLQISSNIRTRESLAQVARREVELAKPRQDARWIRVDRGVDAWIRVDFERVPAKAEGGPAAYHVPTPVLAIRAGICQFQIARIRIEAIRTQNALRTLVRRYGLGAPGDAIDAQVPLGPGKRGQAVVLSRETTDLLLYGTGTRSDTARSRWAEQPDGTVVDEGTGRPAGGRTR